MTSGELREILHGKQDARAKQEHGEPEQLYGLQEKSRRATGLKGCYFCSRYSFPALFLRGEACRYNQASRSS